MRERKPSDKHRNSMLKNDHHIHDYAIPLGISIRKEGQSNVRVQVYKCSRCSATTSHQI